MATNCTSSQSGCTQIYCEAAFLDPGSLYIAVDPTGSGGMALNCNFQTLQYRQPKCDYENDGDPTFANDGSNVQPNPQNFCIGSRWLNVGINPASDEPFDKMWICVDNSFGAAIWVPWLRWRFPADWQDSGPQSKVLMVDNNFAADGEIRRVLNSNPNVGSELVLVPQHTELVDGAVVLGVYGAAPGGNARGASAVDLQNSRSAVAQVASGNNSLIAGGVNNTASGASALAEGVQSTASGVAAHGEGYCDAASFKLASGQGAHAEGLVMAAGTISAGGAGAHAEGWADNALISAADLGSHAEGAASSLSQAGITGTVLATAQGAHAEGNANSGGINAGGGGTSGGGPGTGAHAEGNASGGAVINAQMPGAHAEGNATGQIAAGNVSQILATAAGSHAEGSANLDSTGAYSGVVQATAEGAHAEGSGNAAFILSSGEGSHAEGSAESTSQAGVSGLIQATANGAHAEGSANSGSINAVWEGAHCDGSAEASGVLQASLSGAHAEGHVSNQGQILAGAPAGQTTVPLEGEGAHAEGNAENTGIIEALQNGAHAEGSCDTNGLIQAGNAPGTALGEGAHAEGRAESSGRIGALHDGAHAEGCATDSGTIQAGTLLSGGSSSSSSSSGGAVPGAGAHAEGRASGAGSFILASDDGAHAEGYADAGGNIQSTAPGSHAEGYASGSDLTLAGGLGAHAEGGGTQALADFSHAGGQYSQATLLTQAAHASGMFSQPGDAQATETQMFIATNNSTPTEMTINGQPPGPGVRYAIDPGHSYAITLTVHARDSQAQAHAMFKRMFIIQESNGAVALIGTPQVIGADINPQALGLTINADNTNKSLQILVTGLTGRNIRWLADVEALEIAYFITSSSSVG